MESFKPRRAAHRPDDDLRQSANGIDHARRIHRGESFVTVVVPRQDQLNATLEEDAVERMHPGLAPCPRR